MKKPLKVGALLAAMLVSSAAFAAKPGYAVDQTTDAVTRNSYGECWHTSFFNKAANGLAECGEGAPVIDKKIVTPILVPVRETITLSAKALFDFDKANLRADAKASLDPVLAKARGANVSSIEVTGHTDFMGSDKYNQALSERRANAVRGYFVDNGVPGDRVSAMGKGETEARLTGECKAKKLRKSADLKACLEGDRRVEITINGSREVMIEK